MPRWTLSAFALLVAGCGAGSGQAPAHYAATRPGPESSRPQPAAAKAVPADIVARSAQPFAARRNSDGEVLTQARLLDELSRYDLVCLGEAHDEPRDHYAELVISEGLERRARISGRALGIGFEMFQEQYADALYSYGVGRLDDAGLRRRTQYEKRWGFPYAFYQPLLALGQSYRLPLKALNASQELTRAVAKDGLAKLSPRLRRQVPRELDLRDEEHRARFDQLMTEHPGLSAADRDNYYAAQVVWDETMADNAARWLAERAPSRQLVVIAGSAHCQHVAIPARVERRGSYRTASVRLTTAAPAESEGFDYSLSFDETRAQATTGNAT